MKINTKIMLLVAAGLILTSVVIGVLAVWQLKRSGKMAVARIEQLRPEYRERIKADGKSQIEAFREEIIVRKKEYLKSQVQTAIGVLEKAAKDTSTLIDGTTQKVKTGSDLVAGTNEAFAEVTDSATKVGELVSEISVASSEQARGIEQVNTAVTEMDKVTQQNAENAQQSASSSEEMLAQAGRMKEMLAELVSLVGGSVARSNDEPTEKKPGLGAKIRNKITVSKADDRPQEPAVVREKEPSPAKLIPLADDEFDDF